MVRDGQDIPARALGKRYGGGHHSGSLYIIWSGEEAGDKGRDYSRCEIGHK